MNINSIPRTHAQAHQPKEPLFLISQGIDLVARFLAWLIFPAKMITLPLVSIFPKESVFILCRPLKVFNRKAVLLDLREIFKIYFE